MEARREHDNAAMYPTAVDKSNNEDKEIRVADARV